MAYNHIAKLYDFISYLWTFGRIKKIWKTTVDLIPPGSRVLELGCGTGILAKRIRGKVSSYLGIDASEKMIELAQKNVQGKNIEFKKTDVFKFDEYRKYDVILASMFFAALRKEQVEQLLEDISKRFKGQIVFCEEHRPKKNIRGRLWNFSRHFTRLMFHLMAGDPLEPIHELEPIFEKNGFKSKEEHFFFNQFRLVALYEKK